MARRGGKAANRLSRQRRARAAQARSAARPHPAPAEPSVGEQGGTDAASTSGGSSLGQASAAVRRPATTRPSPAMARISGTGTSRLSERAVAEYHYVQRDLRNIGVLVLAIAILLAVAAVITNLLGIGQVSAP